MKATLNITQQEDKAVTFPALYKDVDSSLVVLFTSIEVGTVVNAGLDYEVGHYDDEWEDCTDTGIWELFTGSITLSND